MMESSGAEAFIFCVHFSFFVLENALGKRSINGLIFTGISIVLKCAIKSNIITSISIIISLLLQDAIVTQSIHVNISCGISIV